MHPFLKELDGKVHIEIKVQPRSSRNQILGEQDGALRVKLTAPPVDGEANQALLAFLAGQLKIPRKNLRIIRGESSRQKLLEVTGLSGSDLVKRLGLP
ncbi:MAG: DUF167 domain-containing protein [Syntrophomonas sp.]|jgi:uncharacterized protein (TIGR00251 family)